MTVTIISRHSKTIHKLVEEQMKKEAQELGFDPWGDTAQEEFERQPTLSSMLLKMLKTTWKSCFMYKRVLAEKQIPLLSSWKQTTANSPRFHSLGISPPKSGGKYCRKQSAPEKRNLLECAIVAYGSHR